MFNLFKSKIRTRFAPSPTGYVHLGSLRSALYEYLFAKQNGGTFFLRIEDTDQSREVSGAVENLLKVLKWAGIEPDEGVLLDSAGKPAEKGKFGPYTQSKRLDLYQKYARELVDQGYAYHCFCTPERLEKLRREQEELKRPTRYDGQCKKLSATEIKDRLAQGEKHVIRMKMPEDKEVEFNDLVRGKVKINTKELDDQVLLKADGFPTYHLAHVVDDHLMESTHIIRAEEWLPSTPKHIILFECFGWTAPAYAHLPLILNKDRSKLSKRQGDVAVEDYMKAGYLPEALINYVALLGWNPGTEQEIFSLDELIKQFSLAKVHKAGAIFDQQKLDWLNGEYIKKLPNTKFVQLARPYLEKNIGALPEGLEIEKILAIEQERISKLSEAGEGIKFLFTDKLEYRPELLIWKKSDQQTTLKNLSLTAEELERLTDWSKNNLEKSLLAWIKKSGLTNGEVLWPLRAALTGQEKSPTPFEIAEILGKEKTLKRINEAIKKLS
ncbi:MAG: glutamate--tRNA ligase [Patescibacteria group bacterium]|jgi:glutamyl-tRNA synthetase